MMRWNTGLAGVILLLGGLTGCKQQLFLTEADVAHYQTLGLPKGLETDPHASIVPPVVERAKTPTTVLDPDRPIRYITLPECIAIALEQGRVGSQSPLFPGIENDQLVQFTGRTVVGDDAIRVLALDPAIVGSDIEAALSKFDTRWVSSMTWNKVDSAVANILQNFQNGDQATLSTALLKPLPTGGVAGITFNTAYNKLSQPPNNQLVNPAYRPSLQFGIEQPLLRDFGVEINQLNPAHPGSFLFPQLGQVGGRVEGVLITRLRFDQQRTEFERNVSFLLFNLEFAYWNLYGSYYNLYSREQALRQAFEAYRLSKARFEAGRIAIQDFAQTRAQFELFRGQRITALGTVLDNERQLRGLLGFPPEDGCRLVPADSPTLAPFTPDWCSAVNDMLANRPELVLARQDLKFRQLDLITQRNQLRPDLRMTATYDMNGIGTRLDGDLLNPDGSTPRNALDSMINNNFNNWQIGFRLFVPIGTRDAHAAVRVARLNLARSYQVLLDQEGKAELFLTLQYRRVFEFYEQIKALRAQREANATQLEARFKEFIVGRGTLDVLLEAQRNWADSLASEYQAITNYNNALCGFQFAKGTLIQYDNVVIAEGELPHVAQVRAVDHQKARTDALILRERADPAVVLPDGATVADPVTGVPVTTSVPVLKREGLPGVLGDKIGSTPATPETMPVPPAMKVPAASAPVPATPYGASATPAPVSLPRTAPASLPATALPPTPPPIPGGAKAETFTLPPAVPTSSGSPYGAIK
jgi:outer membrane protein TolC